MALIKKLMEEYPEEFPEYCEKILDTYFGNIFVTLRNQRILFVNARMAASIKMSKEDICKLSLDELRKKELWARSISKELYESKKESFNAYNVNNLTGEELFTHVEPIFDKNGQILVGTQFSIPRTMLTQFSSYLNKEATAFEKYKQISDYLDDRQRASEELIYKSPAAQNAFNTAKYISGMDSTVLITGQTGTGKDVLANYIYHHSSRADQPFIPVNCSAIPGELVESEFFGYEKGAFTGANVGGKPGLFEMANHGTLFLDEIGELPLSVQAKFLRVLESGEFMHVGGTKVIKTDVRIIAATNHDLKQLVAEGKFREDLYYRLSIMPLPLPPLRERPEDIVELANMFLNRYNKKYGMDRTLTDSMHDTLLSYSWPGNIRELKNVIERYVISGVWDVTPSSLINGNPDSQSSGIQPSEVVPLHEACDEFEKNYIIQALNRCGGSQTKAADLLGIHRSLLYKKIKKYEIDN